MPAPKGNQLWKERQKHGKDKKYSVEKLWEGALKYFQWVEDNPYYEAKAFKIKGENESDEIVLKDVPKMRAMTLTDMQTFLGISDKTWLSYKAHNDYLRVTEDINRIVYGNKFGGAASGFFNANIIARDLGLKEVSETSHNGTISLSDLSEDELNRRLRELEQAHEQSKED